jgi:hypothetical protein
VDSISDNKGRGCENIKVRLISADFYIRVKQRDGPRGARSRILTLTVNEIEMIREQKVLKE